MLKYLVTVLPTSQSPQFYSITFTSIEAAQEFANALASHGFTTVIVGDRKPV